MVKVANSLRQQFLRNTLSLLLIIGLISGFVQIYFMNKHVNVEIQDQANLVTQGIRMQISETDLASSGIEHQIDLRMSTYSKYIATLLAGKDVTQVSQTELKDICQQLGLSGITLFAKQANDIVGVQSTDAAEIGFSFQKVGYLKLGEALLNGADVAMPGATYSAPNLVVLPIAQSQSHTGTPAFFKYAYYHPPGTNYIIDPYIQADEVNQFTKSVGANSWINEMEKTNPNIDEMAVLNPKVFANPTLATKIYPPLKQVIFGKYTYRNQRDTDSLKEMVSKPEKVSYVEREDGHRVYKMFVPINDGDVLYVALNYDRMSQPIYRLSMVLIVFGLIGLIALFFTTARFFNRIYENISKIKSQIKLLETRDFTARSKVSDRGELNELSASTNHMAETLQTVLRDTDEQVEQTQRLSVLLESEASKTMEKIYTMSMKETADGRAAAEGFMDFLDRVESKLQSIPDTSETSVLMDEITRIRNLVKKRTEATTDMTLTLADLLTSLHEEAVKLSDIAARLQGNLSGFKL
ncbi:methyl-accepting chemotaxis protein [Alicyclobacillus acidoterrestris]|uniref:histidine kinase n=2 Tax=Alicyclobacillus TaxID=29330 RepID=T0D449_ALIAG|nr:methyl-accepting chemotaxis protein [Alicyclobacillus acidoterrestris]EPZ44511.1 hypothetical protein N007_10860 [Alicyclobacillus acidoterrestris ATCC 49025]UNO49548.1 methyl-accepting chemotaxis protein [Alicyclobacillus acidoterrestris]